MHPKLNPPIKPCFFDNAEKEAGIGIATIYFISGFIKELEDDKALNDWQFSLIYVKENKVCNARNDQEDPTNISVLEYDESKCVKNKVRHYFSLNNTKIALKVKNNDCFGMFLIIELKKKPQVQTNINFENIIEPINIHLTAFEERIKDLLENKFKDVIRNFISKALKLMGNGNGTAKTNHNIGLNELEFGLKEALRIIVDDLGMKKVLTYGRFQFEDLWMDKDFLQNEDDKLIKFNLKSNTYIDFTQNPLATFKNIHNDSEAGDLFSPVNIINWHEYNAYVYHKNFEKKDFPLVILVQLKNSGAKPWQKFVGSNDDVLLEIINPIANEFFLRLSAIYADILQNELITRLDSSRHEVNQNIASLNSLSKNIHNQAIKLNEALHNFVFSYSNERLRKTISKTVKPLVRDSKQIYSTNSFISSFINMQTVMWEVIYNPKKAFFYPYEEVIFKWAYYYEIVMDQSRGIRLDFEREPQAKKDKYPLMFADSQLINLIVYNLLSNAIKYSHANTVVKLEAFWEKESNDYIIRTTNYGYEAPELGENSIDIFAKGVRSEDAIKYDYNNENGSGLGLFLCKEIIKGHYGRIDHTSEEIFKSNLPLAEYACYIHKTIEGVDLRGTQLDKFYINTPLNDKEKQYYANKNNAELLTKVTNDYSKKLADDEIVFRGLIKESCVPYYSKTENPFTPLYILNELEKPTYKNIFTIRIPNGG